MGLKMNPEIPFPDFVQDIPSYPHLHYSIYM